MKIILYFLLFKTLKNDIQNILATEFTVIILIRVFFDPWLVPADDDEEKNFSQNQKEASDERCLVKIGWNFEKNYYHQEQDNQKKLLVFVKTKIESKESVSFQFSSASQCILKSSFIAKILVLLLVQNGAWCLCILLKIISNCLKSPFPFSN